MVWSGPSEFAISLDAMVTANGWPLPNGFPVVMMSGMMSCIWKMISMTSNLSRITFLTLLRAIPIYFCDNPQMAQLGFFAEIFFLPPYAAIGNQTHFG